MKINIIAVGKLKEVFYREAEKEYLKRLSKYCQINIIEVPDERAPEKLSPGEEEQVKKREGEKILAKIPGDSVVVTLEIEGKQLDSVSFSDKIHQYALHGKSEFTFIIGGSLGLSEEVKKVSSWRISFSQMTFPHQLMRVILLEQIFRAFKIARNEAYHK